MLQYWGGVLKKKFVKFVVQDLTSGGIDWQREKWKSGFGSKFIRQGEKNAVKYISSDEVTGEPLEGNGDFHHKNKKTIYTDPVQRLNPNKGILVNKQTHRDIHKNNINNEEDLNKYIKERRESK
nr:hypothetical protein [Clostridium sp. Marseille-P7770]